MNYKKMAGTSAIFVIEGLHANKPVERQGMTWSAQELHLDSIPPVLTPKPEMATSLALEGLESYDAPAHGDVRKVGALDATFVYIAPVKAWIELESY